MPETQPTALEVELALSLDAVRAERDAALAKLEAAEAIVKSFQNDAPHQLKRFAELHQRATTAEQRVRVLEAALKEVALPCHDFDCDERPAIARDVLAKAAPESAVHGETVGK